MTELGRGARWLVVGDGLPARETVGRAVIEQLDNDRRGLVVRCAVDDERREQVLLVEFDP